MSTGEKQYTVKELAERWNRSQEQVRRYIRQRKLRAYGWGGYRIPQSSVDDFERKLTENRVASCSNE